MFLLRLDFGELVKGDFVSNITAIFTSKISGFITMSDLVSYNVLWCNSNYSGGILLTQRIYSPQSRKERKENFIFLFTVERPVNRRPQKLRFI